MTFFEKKDRILNALIDRKGLQYLIDVISATLDNPFYVYDISGKVLAKSQDKESKAIWAELLPGGCLDANNIKMAEQAGVIEKIMNNDEPVWGNFVFSSYNFWGCRIRDKGSIVGVSTIVEIRPMPAENGELLVIACKAILYEMLYRERTAMQTIPYFSLFKDIIENTVSKHEIRERSQVLHVKFPKVMRLLGIKFSDHRNNSLSLYFLRETLLASIPPCFCIIYDESLLLMLSEQYFNKALLNTIKQMYPSDDTRIGVSRPFTSILGLRRAFEEMKAIQSVYQKLEMDKPLTYYEDILLYHLMEIVSKENDLSLFCSPIIYRIEEYDQENKTQLKESLEAFLESSRNIQKAADKLHVHKNTLYYRLKRLEELFELNLNDENLCFTLQFSYRMRRMIK